MEHDNIVKISLLVIAAASTFLLCTPQHAAAHCDTLDGPVVQDARKAIEARDITPVLKWVQPKDEKTVRAAFNRLITGKAKDKEAAERTFFAALVKIHRAGEGAPFSGLKPAGTVEAAVAEADRALTSGSADALVKLIADDTAAGIKVRFERVAAAYLHKDESVAQGRQFVEAYVDFTHYVERLHHDASGKGAHGEHAGHGRSDIHNQHTKESQHL